MANPCNLKWYYFQMKFDMTSDGDSGLVLKFLAENLHIAWMRLEEWEAQHQQYKNLRVVECYDHEPSEEETEKAYSQAR